MNPTPWDPYAYSLTPLDPVSQPLDPLRPFRPTPWPPGTLWAYPLVPRNSVGLFGVLFTGSKKWQISGTHPLFYLFSSRSPLCINCNHHSFFDIFQILFLWLPGFSLVLWSWPSAVPAAVPRLKTCNKKYSGNCCWNRNRCRKLSQ